MSIPQAQLQRQRADIGQRTAALLERYDALDVLPLRVQVAWISRPWWQRAWLRIRGEKPDVGAIVQSRMEELDQNLVGPCPAKKNGIACMLHERHDGPHRRRSIGDVIVTWEDEENDAEEGQDGD